MTAEAPLPPAPSLTLLDDRFDRAFVPLGVLGAASAALFAEGLGAVVFAITLFLYGQSLTNGRAGEVRAHQKDETRSP
jgi:hypothetical protein